MIGTKLCLQSIGGVGQGAGHHLIIHYTINQSLIHHQSSSSWEEEEEEGAIWRRHHGPRYDSSGGPFGKVGVVVVVV